MSRILVALAALSLVACSDQSDPSPAEPGDGSVTPAVTSPLELSASHVPRGAHTALSGGATTVFDVTPGAFSLPAPNLDARTAAAQRP